MPLLMQLSLPGLSLEPAHMLPGAALSVSNLSLSPASFAPRLLSSACFALARITVPDSSRGCAFQVHFPWKVYGDVRSLCFRLELAFEKKKQQIALGAASFFPYWGFPGRRRMNIVMLWRVPFPEAALPHRPALFSFFSGGFDLDPLMFWSQSVGVSSSEAFQHAPPFRTS